RALKPAGGTFKSRTKWPVNANYYPTVSHCDPIPRNERIRKGGGALDVTRPTRLSHPRQNNNEPGERLIGRVPQGPWKIITFVAVLRRNGMRAPCTVAGSMNGAKFLAYARCSRVDPGDIKT